MSTTSEALTCAIEHHRGGRLPEAEQIYRQILQTNPNQVDALHLLGLIAHQVGNHEAAVEYISRAIRGNGNAADAHSNLGLAYFAWGKVPEAIASYRRSLNLQPNDAKVWMILGVALKDQRQFVEAIACYRRALELQPQFAEAHGNLGNVLREQGRLDDAIASYCRLLELKPHVAEAHNNLAIALQEQGKLQEAVASYRRALQLKPNFAEAHGSLGNALKELGAVDEAIQCYRRAIQLKPNLVEAHGNMGIALMDQGRPEEAMICYRQALQLKPDDPATLNNLANALTNRGRLTEAVACLRRALELAPDDAAAWNNLGTACKDQGMLDEAIASFQRAIDLKPHNTMAHSNLLMTLQYRAAVTLAELAEAHAEFDRLYVAPLKSITEPRPFVPSGSRRLRLGFVSADFGRHPVGFFLVRVVENLFPADFEIICYSDRKVKDDITRRFEAVSSQWRDCTGISDERLAERIRADRIDILFDLGGHTGHNRMPVFARQPAPVSITWIGYEGTTGLSTIDYLIADRLMIPEGSEIHFREKIWRMPDGYLCYEPPTSAPDISAAPALNNGYPTFGSFNNLAKITPQVVQVWSEILRASANSRLVMKYNGLGDAQVKQRYLDAFSAHGIDASRLRLQPASSYADYLETYRDVDLMLDPFPFSGSTTTCEALWMGVPVITCPFETFASRHSLSHLTNIGTPETIAGNIDEYVKLAVRTSQDVPQLDALRSVLRERMRASPLCDGKAFARNLTSLLHSIWNDSG